MKARAPVILYIKELMLYIKSCAIVVIGVSCMLCMCTDNIVICLSEA